MRCRNLIGRFTGYSVMTFGKESLQGTAGGVDVDTVDVPRVCDRDSIVDLQQAAERQGRRLVEVQRRGTGRR